MNYYYILYSLLFLMIVFFFVTSTIYWINFAKGKIYRDNNRRHGYNKLEILQGTNQTRGLSYGESVQFVQLSADSEGRSYDYVTF